METRSVSSLLLNQELRERVAAREDWGEVGWKSWAQLEAKTKALGLGNIYLVLRPGSEVEPLDLDRVKGVQTAPRFAHADIIPGGVAPILEASSRAIRYLEEDDAAS